MTADAPGARESLDYFLSSLTTIPDRCLPFAASCRLLATKLDQNPNANTGRELRQSLDRLLELLGDEPPPPSDLDKLLARREARLHGRGDGAA